jgi:hypothetical protein
MGGGGSAVDITETPLGARAFCGGADEPRTSLPSGDHEGQWSL